MSTPPLVRVAAGEVEIAVHRTGRLGAPPVFVLHGFTGDASSMQEASSGLCADYDVLAVDFVGHGASDVPREVAAYTMGACVEQLLSVCKALEIPSAHWLGYSMGGRAALSLAQRAPERVRSLVLVGASAGLAEAEARAERVAADEALARRIEADGLAAFVDHWMALPLFASQKRLGPEKLARARDQRLRNRVRGLANSLRGMGTGAMPPLHAGLAAIDRPVALVVGDEDLKFRGIAEALEAALPDARTLLIREAGHAAHLEQPAEFARVALGFLAQAEAAWSER